MKSKIKIWMISAGCLGLGFVLLVIGWTMGGRPGFYINRTGIHAAADNNQNGPYILEKKKLGAFDAMVIEVCYADVEILPSDGYYIEYRMDGSVPAPKLEVKNKALEFREGSENRFINLNFFNFDKLSRFSEPYYVRVYVPEEKYFSFVEIESDNGTIKIGSIQAEEAEISNDCGPVELESFQGDRLHVEMDSGHLKINNLDARTIGIANAYGNCELGAVSVQHMEAELGNGNFSIEKYAAKNLEIQNEYGNVDIGISKNMKDYDFDLYTEHGTIELPGYYGPASSDGDESRYRVSSQGEHKIKVLCEDGDITMKEL